MTRPQYTVLKLSPDNVRTLVLMRHFQAKGITGFELEVSKNGWDLSLAE